MAIAHDAREVEIDVEVATVRCRVGGEGPPVLVLHRDVGSFGWTPFHEVLASQFTVYEPDLPGFGQSSRPEWARHPRDLAAIILALVRNLDLRDCKLVGCGFGGWVAAEMAMFAPERFSSLTLVSSAGIKPDTADILDQIMMDPTTYVRSGFSDPSQFEVWFPDNDGLAERWELCREMVARVSWKPYMYSYELAELLKTMKLPTKVIWGSEDGVIPVRCADILAEIIPDCTSEIVGGAGHYVELERPEVVANAIGITVQEEAESRVG